MNTNTVNNDILRKLGGVVSGKDTTYEVIRKQVEKLGGDLTKVNDIYTGELQVLENIGGGAGKMQDKSISITENGTTNVTPDEGYDGLTNVDIEVNVPISPAMDVTYTENGIYEVLPDSGDAGIKKINVSVEVEPNLQDKNITENGTYTADSGYDGLKSVTVNVESGGSILAMTQAEYDALETKDENTVYVIN